jgi:thymidylate synthase ThyX
MAYMEQSTRYISYDSRLPNGRYRYYRDPDILSSALGARYVGEMDRMFDTYAGLVPVLQTWFAAQLPKPAADSDFAYRQSIRAKAFDALRGMLPAAATSNVGIYGTGQAYEALLLRMRAHPLPEAHSYADLMLTELRKVIPSFLRRVDAPDRGGAWTEYLERNQRAMQDLADGLFGQPGPVAATVHRADGPEVRLVEWDPEAETKVVASMLYPYTSLPESSILARVERMSVEERLAVMRKYSGERGNRRHRPGRALERVGYRFDVLSDYGAFRDLQRHRMLTVEWQRLTPGHGYQLPAAVVAAGAQDAYDASMVRSADLYDLLLRRFGWSQASYAVALAFRVRYVMHLNAREAMHLIELRTTAQGHPEYRKVCQQMHRLIADQAGHLALATLMSFVDHRDYELAGLERLEGERRAEQRREANQPDSHAQ